MKLSTLRDRLEAACPPCHLGLLDPLWDQFAALLPAAGDLRRHSSVGLPPPPDRGSDRVRQAGPGAAVRLLLRGDRRHHLLGDHATDPPRRVDQRSGCSPQLTRIALRRLRPHRRTGARRHRRGRVHHQGSRRRRGRRPVAGRPAQTGHETLGAGRGLRHPAGPGPGRGAPPRLAAAGADPGPARRSRPAARARSPCTSTPATTRARPATLSAERGLHGEIAHKGEKAPIQASQRWHVERTNAWHNAFNRLQRCYERREARDRRVLRPRRRDHHRA